MLRSALLGIALVAAVGCRHIEVLDAGPAPGPDALLIVDVADSSGSRVEGAFVEIDDRDGHLATRFTTDAEAPVTIPDLPPGAYRVHVDMRPIGGSTYSCSLDAEAGRALAVVFEDGARTRAAIGDAALVAGEVVLVVAWVGLEVVTCGHCGNPHFRCH